MNLRHVDWSEVSFKTYKENQLQFYTALNSPKVYTPANMQFPPPAMTWSATMLGGAVATMIVLLATIVEFIPTVYIAYIPLIVGIAQFFVSIIATIAFGLFPSRHMFSDRVAGKSCKYMALQTFTASYPELTRLAHTASIMLWLLVFGCKFAEDAMINSSAMPSARTVPFTLTIMYIMDLILFFLDTYLWYIIWVVVFSIGRSFSLGLSIWMPWKDVFSCLPKCIYAKLLATTEMEVKYKPKVIVLQIWNAIIISMYREHLLGIDHIQRLLYHQVDSRHTLNTPPFFLNQKGGNSKNTFFPANGEAERRISFFANSLTTTLPEPLPVDVMPTFTVLVRHYSEKILLSLREIIREEDQNTRVTLLGYLKQLHSVEWDNFVKDTKILAGESEALDGTSSINEKYTSNKADNLPFYCIGFKTSGPEYTLHTRICASLRAQTLYHTAVKLLYSVENPAIVSMFSGNTEKLEQELERMAQRKFKFTISMQRFSKFNKEEQENAEFLLRAYPDMQIAYLDGEVGPKGSEPRLLSTFIDGHSEIDEVTDNQNHAIIFYHECLKIRNILGDQSPYAQCGHKEFKQSPYIFSENIGEHTFGTMTARALVHPDFLNALFMTTRGGVSKAQKGLHLNEDIFAGTNAFGRGGRIKHSEYYQFSMILNFQTKISTGMGEQMLSRDFHINDILVIYSIQVLMVTSLYIGTLNKQLTICQVDSQGNVLSGQQSSGCYNLIPVFDWIRRCIVSIFLVSFIAFLPLFLQELVERGTSKVLLSPIFGVFSTQIYSQAILSNLTFSGARYITTGRSFATTRISFSILYSRFAGPSIYMGMRNLLILLYVLLAIWIPYLIYFWFSVLSLCIAPFIFNPRQFSFVDFIIGYRNSRTKASSCHGYCRLSRIMITGYKKKKLGHPSEKLSGDLPRAPWRAVRWFLELWDASHAVLGVITIVAIQCAIQKILIAVFLSRKYKPDETNCA
ncbi:1,3-beta-glucan synthase component-domain-containing protein [Suillus ampliporus]|nr:1,3-beta-glucan synthase component-domain-containing protein [Suillus ampliporus]